MAVNNPAGILPAAGQWFNNPNPGYYPGQTNAGFNPIQQQGWGLSGQGYQQGYGAANQNAQWANNLANSAISDMNAGGGMADVNAGDIGSQYLNMLSADEINGIQGNFQVNPYVNDQVNAYQDSFNRGFQRSLPQYSTDAMQAGQMGSSRHGISEGLARSDFQRQLGEGTAALTNNAWAQAAQNQLTSRGQTLSSLGQDRARGTNAAMSQAGNRTQLENANANNRTSQYGMIPGMIGAMTNANMLPSQVMTQGGNWLAGVGDRHQGLAQNQINSQMNQWDYLNNAGANRIDTYSNMINGAGAGQYGNNQQVVNQPGFFQSVAPILGAAGGLLSGGAAAGLFGSAGGIQ